MLDLNLDFQIIIDVVGMILAVSTPIFLILGIASKALNALIGMVLGKEKIEL